MNKIQITGRLTRDPEIRYGGEGNQTCIARFSVAVPKRFKRQGEAEADFINCTAFGKTGELIEKYVAQGDRIGVSGRLENNNYTDRNGVKHYDFVVTVEEIDLIETKREKESNQPQSAPFQPQQGYLPQAYASQPAPQQPQYTQQSFVQAQAPAQAPMPSSVPTTQVPEQFM